jgi:Pro-kumamolisin, activation domain/Bacterial Ig-like domain (group 3)
MHPLATPANESGRVEAGRSLQRIVLLLSPSPEQTADLQKFTEDLHNRNSPNYHRWLTPEAFAARFGLADADLAKVQEWLQRSGFTLGNVARSRRWIEFSGTSHQVEQALHTEMHYYTVGGKKYLANNSDIAIPQALSGITSGVRSLNSFGHHPPISSTSASPTSGSPARDISGDTSSYRPHLQPDLTATGQTNTYYLAPGDFSMIYNTKPLLNAGVDGTGISIAVTAQSQIELTDVQMFRQIFGLKPNDPNFLLSGPDPGIVGPIDLQEAQLDVEWAGAVAPGATIDLVVAATTDTTNGVDLAAAYAIDNDIAPIMTFTYGGCEQALGAPGNAFFGDLWQQAAAEGITVVVATGDNGAAGCDNQSLDTPAQNGLAINGAASTPYNLAVGGTEFNDSAHQSTYWSANNSSNFTSALGYIPEAAWNESCDPAQPQTPTNCLYNTANVSLLASGGGTSVVYTKPSWQMGTGVPADGHRDVPDVALAAAGGHDQTVYCTSLGGAACQITNGNVVGLTLVGGTSVATPEMAGILALVEQKNGAYQGQVNYTLYKLAQTNSCNSSTQTNPTAQNSCVFYDVTMGNNSVPCAGGTVNCSSTQSGVNGIISAPPAGVGYDLATGLGSVNASNLANEWNSVALAASQTAVQAGSTTFAHGTPVSLSVTVSPASATGTPSGNVSLKTDGAGDAPDLLTLTNGAYTGSISDLPGGTYNLHAHYAGDANFAPSDSAPVSFTVTPEPSTSTLSVVGLQNATVPYGASLELRAAVTPASGSGNATGSVTILDGATTVGTYLLTQDGGASIFTGAYGRYSFAPGPHSITAVYSGDNSFNASTSSAVVFSVGKGTPFVIVGANSSSVITGQSVGVHAVVSGGGTSQATGSVQFTVDGAPVGPAVTLQTGGFFGTQAQASAILAALVQGSHVIGATYNSGADLNYTSVQTGDPQNESTFQITVGAASGTQTTTSLTAVNSPVNLGDTGTFKVSVSPSSATGTVSLWDAVGIRTSPVTLAGGTATIQLPWPQAGTVTLYAVYSGDATKAPSSSATTQFTVNLGVPQIALAAQAPSGNYQQATINVSVTGKPSNSLLAYPTGLLEIWDSVNSAPAQLLTVQSLSLGAGNISVYGTRSKLVAGSHSLYAHYRGDNNWQAETSSTVSLTVASGDFALAITPSPIVFKGGTAGSGTVTINQVNGFAGTVNLSCPMSGTNVLAGYTCTITPSSVVITSGAQTATVNLTPVTSSAGGVGVATNRNLAGTATFVGKPGLINIGYAGALLLLLFLLLAGTAKLRSAHPWMAVAATCLFTLSLVAGCGGGGGGGGGGGPVPTTTTISSPGATNITVTVRSSATAGGSVVLTIDGANPLSGAVSAGIAQFNLLGQPVGIHTLLATYSGDTANQPSTSAPFAFIITGNTMLQVVGTSGSTTHTASALVTVN